MRGSILYKIWIVGKMDERYPKAARFIDTMEQDRIDQHGGPGAGAKSREVLVGPEYLTRRGK